MLKKILVGIFALAITFGGAPAAHAGAPVSCGPDLSWDGQKCQVIAASPGAADGHSGGSDAVGSLSGDAAPRTCAIEGSPVPCHDSDLGWWSDGRGCYVQITTPQPPKTVAAWSGHTDGAIYNCSLPHVSMFGGLVYLFWSAAPPAGPDPLVLAQTAIASMNLTPVTIGIVPEDKPGSVGLVGLPVWLWASSPDQHSWGPITRSASAGGFTVTATAKVTKVRWQMGDGGVVVCTGPGTVYEDRFGKSDSPTCGYTYTRQGTYTVRAESTWSVAWSGMGRSGTIPVTLNRATTITVGELQVITVG